MYRVIFVHLFWTMVVFTKSLSVQWHHWFQFSQTIHFIFHFLVGFSQVMCQRQSSGFGTSGLCWPCGSTLLFLSIIFTMLWQATQRRHQWHNEVPPISYHFRFFPLVYSYLLGCSLCTHLGNSPSTRYILVDWLVEVATMKDFSSLALHVTVGCVDRYLARRSVPKARLQLLGIACMVICTRWGPGPAHFLSNIGKKETFCLLRPLQIWRDD